MKHGHTDGECIIEEGAQTHEALEVICLVEYILGGRARHSEVGERACDQD